MPRLGHHSHHQPGIPGHGPAPDCPGPRRHHSRGHVRQMENRLPAGFLHRLPAGPDLDAHAGIPALLPGPACGALPVARIRSFQFPVPVHSVGLHHPDRVFRGRLLRGRAQILPALRVPRQVPGCSSLRMPERGMYIHSLKPNRGIFSPGYPGALSSPSHMPTEKWKTAIKKAAHERQPFHYFLNSIQADYFMIRVSAVTCLFYLTS